MAKQKFRTLVDTGADCCLLRGDIYNNIRSPATPLLPSGVILQNASGKHIPLLGKVSLKFEMGGQSLSQEFQVSNAIKTPVILGRDFITEKNLYIKLGENKCELNGQEIPLCDFDEITSIVRLTEPIEIPAQHVVSTYGEYHKHFDYSEGKPLLVQQTTSNFLANEPGLLLINGLVDGNKKRKVPLTFVNTTQRHFTLNKGNVVATVSHVGDAEINEIRADVDSYFNSEQTKNEKIY